MRIIGNNPAAENAEITAIASGTLPDGKAVVVNADGTVSVVGIQSISTAAGTPSVFDSSESGGITCSTFDSNSNRVVVAYRDADNSGHGTALVGTVNAANNSISFGTAVIFNAANGSQFGATFDSNVNKVVLTYKDSGNSSKGTAIVGTVDPSDNSISFGTEAVFESASVTSMSMAYNSAAQKTIISYLDGGDSNKVKIIEATVSGTAISFGSVVDTTTVSSAGNFKVAFDSTENVIFLPLKDDAVDHTDAYVFRSAYTQITRDQVASGSRAIVDIGSAVSANQLSLTAGQQYFVQTDGTLGLTADDPSVIAGTAVSATDIIVKG